jgi:hypothetical protein
VKHQACDMASETMKRNGLTITINRLRKQKARQPHRRAARVGLLTLTLQEFIDQLRDSRGITYQNTPPHRHLTRIIDGRKKIGYIPAFVRDTDQLSPDVIRLLCSQLEIPAAEFQRYLPY